MKVKPAQGRAIRYPDPPFQFLSADGAEVPETPYWRRRMAQQDVVLVEDEAKKPARTTREAGKALDHKEG